MNESLGLIIYLSVWSIWVFVAGMLGHRMKFTVEEIRFFQVFGLFWPAIALAIPLGGPVLLAAWLGNYIGKKIK